MAQDHKSGMMECHKPVDLNARATQTTTRLQFFRVMTVGLALVCARACNAQVLHGSTETGIDGPVTSAPPGLDVILDSLWQHDSYTGWSDVLLPAVEYRFNQHFLAGASIPLFLSANTYTTTATASAEDDDTSTLQNGHDLRGDVETFARFELTHQQFHSQITATVGYPTGNRQFALTAGTTTFNINNLFEYTHHSLTPYLALGEGNNSSLAEPAIRKDYIAVGQIANFQVGLFLDLPLRLSLDLSAFEDLPIGRQQVYGTISSSNDTSYSGVQSYHTTIEDNGIAAGMNVPIAKHLLLHGSYERSIIQHLDIATAGIRWTLRPHQQ